MTERAGKVAPFESLDILRGLAALWVVMCHAAEHYVGGTSLERWPIFGFSMRGQLGVMLFFVISGYCITGAAYSAFASGKKVRRFAFDRARRIYPPYLSAVALGVAYAGSLILAERRHLIPMVHHPIPLSARAPFWLANLLMIQCEARQEAVNGDYWSLCYEVVFYAIIGAILLIAQWIRKRWSAQAGLTFLSLAVTALTVESLAWQIATGDAGPFPMDLWYQFGLGGLFFLAVEIGSSEFAGYSPKVNRVNWTVASAGVALTIVFAITRAAVRDPGGRQTSRLQCCAILFYLALFWVLRKVKGQLKHRRILKPLVWLGSFSYSLYLIHAYFLGLVDVPARRMGCVGNYYVISWFLQIIVAVFAAWVFYLLVERRFVSSRQKRRIATELAEAS